MMILKTGLTRKKTTRQASGMTLLEVILAVSIIVFLVGVTAIGLRSLSSSGSVRDAVENFAVGLRMTRAEAASQGKRFQLTFDDELGAEIMIETEPISAPGQFVKYKACMWSQRLTDPQLRVTATKITGANAFNTLMQLGDIADEEERLQAITFNADGSSDSAEISLAPRNENDTRRFIVKLDGMNGKTTIERKDDTEENNSETEDEDF